MAAAVGIVVFGVEPTTTAGRSAADPPSIPLTVATTDIGLKLIADVAIGGKLLKVVLDTGSTGLHVLASAVPPEAVRRTGPAPEFGYANGIKLSGDIAQATVQIGGHTTAGPIPIELVTDTSCDPDHPDCGAANGKTPTVWGGQFDGNMGVGMRDVEGVVNPLWRLPNGLGHAFAVHYEPAGATTLLLGEPQAGYRLVHLDKGGPASKVADSPPPWYPFVSHVCFTAVTLPGDKTCGPTLFDTGTPAINMLAPGADDSDVPAGTAIELSVGDGTFSHTYTTGPGTPARISGGPQNSIAGLPTFAAADIRYDLANGTIGFRPR